MWRPQVRILLPFWVGFWVVYSEVNWELVCHFIRCYVVNCAISAMGVIHVLCQIEPAYIVLYRMPWI